MSGNENVSGTAGEAGPAAPAGPADRTGAGWGWEPVPQGGEYDSEATAFVKLPQDMLDALGTGEPLAAPGHGYVPPPMIVPLGSASADPAATGTWTIPVQWPEAGTPQAGPGTGGAGAAGTAAPAPVGGPIPASIPIPASVAAAFADQSQGQVPGHGQELGQGQAHGHAQGQAAGHGPASAEAGHDPGATAEWRFPEAVQDSEPVTTGQWTLPELPEETGEFRRSGLEADWSQAPATLPGGAAAPWATHPGFEAAAAARPEAAADAAAGAVMSSGVLPDARSDADDAGTSGAGLRRLGGPGVGGPGRGPRVLGGPGVGTLPEGEPAHPAPHDIEAAHGPAATPVTAERPHPGAEAPELQAVAVAGAAAVAAGPARASEAAGAAAAGAGEPAAEREREVSAVAAAEYALAGGPGADGIGGVSGVGGTGGFAEPGDTNGHGFTASGHAAAGAEPGPAGEPGEHGFSADPAGTDGHGFAVGPGQAAGVVSQAGADGGLGPGPGEAGAAAVPGADTADSAVATPDAGTAGGFPLEGPTYEEEATAEAVAHHEHPLASYVLRVNGADRPVTGAWIGESLLYVLRERLGLAGAKDGCSQGECGACAVQVDGRLVASCLVPAATAASSEVRTVEGLASGGELSDVQQALCRSGAVQCGFCVPGMAMTIHDLLEGNHAPSELETRQALCGNLCRCSGYKGVIEAVREVVAEREATAAADAPAAGPAPGNGSGLGNAAGNGPEARIPHQAPPGEGGIHHHGGMA
ncbi:2Fe-2S iron-sulfur cluster-binding protein [Streptomyces sp. NPDC057686]|uniref:2Fe-2S iron-sulfur cluster-binding protein n=1 Tax=Streptomyces sp. NPDC057686 TaxID=3346212 RepID=UPI0036CCF725